MIIYINYSKEIKKYQINEGESIVIADKSITIDYHNELTIHFIKDNLKKRIVKAHTIINGINIFIVKKINLKFTKYIINHEVTIGSNEVNDIVINNVMVSDLFGKIKDNTLTNPYGVYINDKLMYKKTLENGDIIDIYGVLIIYHQKFLMINNPSYLSINLDLFQDYIPSVLKDLNYNIITKYRKDFLIQEKIIKLKDPIQLMTKNRQNLFTNIGPIVTLSLASLSIGLINIYNQQSKSIIQILPSIIFPSVMLFSAFFWQPLNHIMNNHYIKKHNKLRYTKYSNYLEEIIIKEKKYLQDIENDYHVAFKTVSELLKLDDLFYKQKYHHDYLVLNLGEAKIDSKVKFIKPSIIKEEDDLFDLINKKVDELSKINLGLFLDLKTNRKIKIIYTEDYLKYLLLQLFVYFSNDNLNIIILKDNLEYDYLNWSIHLRTSNNQLLLANNIDDIKMINSNIREDLDYIVLVFNDKLVDQLKINNPILIYLVSDINNMLYNYDALINVKKDNYAIINNCRYEFNYDNTKIDLKDINLKILNQHKSNINNNFTFFDLHHYDLKNIDYKVQYKPLVVTLGRNKLDEVVELDISEKKDGPHGLIVGMTGSGKSELIISFILSLVYKYSYEQVEFILIDFKGSSVIDLFSKLPHVIGTVSNLDGNQIIRALESLKNECIKRQKLFKDLATITNENISNILTYQKFYKKEYGIKHLSNLVIIVDEFAELKYTHNTYIKDLISIARTGRSLGIHLILTTQKPSGVIDSQIWSNCHFKICMKVNEDNDSYEVIKSNLASKLTSPGELYIKVDENVTYAKTSLATISSKYYNYNNKVHILDHNFKVINSNYLLLPNSISQCSYIVNKIIENNPINKNYLWNKELEIKSYNDIITSYNIDTKDTIILGEYDDLENSIQDLLLYNLNSLDNIFIFSTSSISKVQFINNILYQLINEPINTYIIDDKLENYNWFNNGYTSIILEDDEIMVDYLFNNILDNSILIINNFSKFKDNDKLINIINTSRARKITLIITTNLFNNISLSLTIYFKLCIGLNPSDIEISNVFYNKFNKYNFDDNSGIYKYHQVNYFKYLVNDKIICNKLPYIIKKLPDIISHNYINHKLLIGYNTNTLKEIYYEKGVLLVTGYNIEQLNTFKKSIMKLKCVSYNSIRKTKINVIDDIDIYNSNILNNRLIIIIKHNSKTFNKIDADQILWLGKDINNQFDIYSVNKKISNSCGLYINNNAEEIGRFI